MKKRCTKTIAAILAICLLVAGIGGMDASAQDDTGFTDLEIYDWVEPFIEKAVELELFKGTSPDTFTPEGIFTRAEAMTVLGRMHEKICGGILEFDPSGLFNDVTGKYAYCAPYVAWAQKNGIVTGYSDGTFRPGKAVTSHELAVIAYRYLDYVGELHKYDNRYGEFGFDDSGIPAWAKKASWALANWEINDFSSENVYRYKAVEFFVKLYERLTYPADFTTSKYCVDFYTNSMLTETEVWVGKQERYTIFDNYDDYARYLGEIAAQAYGRLDISGWPEDLLEVSEDTFEQSNVLAVEVRADGMPAYRCDLGRVDIEGDKAALTLIGSGYSGSTADVKGVLIVIEVPKEVSTCEIDWLSWTEYWFPMG